ncbi:MAG: transglycosylase SLT domain-containing protein [Bacteroidales bacterium]|nr:transglycosylase SLT domain-containing protein [Bacteroidales bacterium]
MKKKDIVTIILAAIAISAIVAFFFVREKYLTSKPEAIGEGRELRCAMGFRKDPGGADGHKLLLAGLNYDFLKDFAGSKSLADSIFVIRSDEYVWADSLREGSLDLVVLPYADSLPAMEGVLYSDPIDSLSVWAVGASYGEHLDEINGWLAEFSESEDFEERVGLFCDTVNPSKDAARGLKADHISPYDDLFKQHAAHLGWDWRLLAAVAYHESRFSILSHSPKGASGIMQVKPSSARRYGVSDLLDPEENISAGANHFLALQKRYRSTNFTPTDRIRFVLAAYNTGSARMHGYMDTADSLSLNRYSWSDVLPMINSSTVSYVDSIFSTYEDICRIIDK